jgi:hypothetical protein
MFPADDEVEGLWSHDRTHAPRPLSPLAFELITDTLAIGFTAAHHEFGAPIDMFARSVNSYLYTSFRPTLDSDDLRLRAERYVHLPTVLDEIGSRWELEWKPWLMETVRLGRVAEYHHLTHPDFDAEPRSSTGPQDWTIPIDALRSYVRLSDDHDPAFAFQAAARRRVALVNAARTKLADNPDALATFDRFHEAGRHNLPMTEDHAFWIDQSGVANFRRFLLHLGERLVRDGCLDRADDLFFLTRAEIGDALAHGGDYRNQSTARRLATAAATAAPRTIGTPPPPTAGELDPLLDAIANRQAGRRQPQLFDIAATFLTGHAASTGRVTGTARVVRSLADAANSTTATSSCAT